MQFYEVATYAVSCGVICLAVFRALKREAFGAVWDFEHPFVEVDSRHIVVGVLPYQLHSLEYSMHATSLLLLYSPRMRQNTLSQVAGHTVQFFLYASRL
jgi:hypothetical protein